MGDSGIKSYTPKEFINTFSPKYSEYKKKKKDKPPKIPPYVKA